MSRCMPVRKTNGVFCTVRAAATEKLLRGQGLDAVGNSQAEFEKLYTAEINTWAKVVKTIGMQPN